MATLSMYFCSNCDHALLPVDGRVIFKCSICGNYYTEWYIHNFPEKFYGWRQKQELKGVFSWRRQKTI